MKHPAAFLLFLFLSGLCAAQQFSLQDEKGVLTGPFALKDGTEVAVGSDKAVITQVRFEREPLFDALREIIVPQVAFRQTSIRDVVAFLQKTAAEKDPKKRGLNLALRLPPGQDGAGKVSAITFSARDITVLDALRSAARIANLKICVCKGVVTIMPVEAPEDELFIRKYTIMPTAIDRTTAINGNGSEFDPKQYLGDMGIPWPTGSWVHYLSVVGTLQVCNTRKNLDLLGQLIAELGCAPRQIKIDVQIVSFDLTNITRLATSGAGINTATLTELWTNGCGELLAAPTVTTKAGQEGMVKGDTEVIYPTAFDINVGNAMSSTTGVFSAASGGVLPYGYQTRETGVILQVLPEVRADGESIDLILNPQIVEAPQWRNFGPSTAYSNSNANSSPMKQPFFHMFLNSTSVSLVSGQRTLVGGGMPTRDHKRAVYIFAIATLVNEKGEPYQFNPNYDEQMRRQTDAVFTPRFSLQDGNGNVTGPFQCKDGGEFKVGPHQGVITQVRTEEQQEADRLKAIVIPAVSVMQASAREVVEYVQQIGRTNDPKKCGVNLVLGMTEAQEAAAKPEAITFTAKNASLYDTLCIVTEIANLKFRVLGGTVLLLPSDAPEDVFLVRRYRLMRNVLVCGAVSNEFGIAQVNRPVNLSLNQDDDLKKALSGFGGYWPVGSSIKYVPAAEKLFVRNTRENLDILDKVFADVDCSPRQIQIDAQFVAFDLSAISRLAAAGKSVDLAVLSTLWTNGCGELLAAPTVLTKAGQEALVKGVTEVIYPTCFDVAGLNSSGASNVAPTVMNGDLLPGNFQTRDVGVILQVVPEVSAEGRTLNLTANPQLIEDPAWHDFGSPMRGADGKERTSQIQQPFFHVYSTSTSATFANGRRMIVGGGMPRRTASAWSTCS